MSNVEFRQFAVCCVLDYINSLPDLPSKYGVSRIAEQDVYIVWSCKTLQNHKAILSCTVGEYLFEVTWDGDKDRGYLDAYDKVINMVVMPK